MSEEPVVGRMDWDVCERCVNYPPDKGGCDVDAPEDISNFTFDEFGDRLICLRFKEKPPRTEGGG